MVTAELRHIASITTVNYIIRALSVITVIGWQVIQLYNTWGVTSKWCLTEPESKIWQILQMLPWFFYHHSALFNVCLMCKKARKRWKWEKPVVINWELKRAMFMGSLIKKISEVQYIWWCICISIWRITSYLVGSFLEKNCQNKIYCWIYKA